MLTCPPFREVPPQGLVDTGSVSGTSILGRVDSVRNSWTLTGSVWSPLDFPRVSRKFLFVKIEGTLEKVGNSETVVVVELLVPLGQGDSVGREGVDTDKSPSEGMVPV